MVPQKVRRQLKLKPDDSVEIVILDYYPSTTDPQNIGKLTEATRFKYLFSPETGDPNGTRKYAEVVS